MLKSLRTAALAGALFTTAAAAQPIAISTLPPGAINNVQATVIAKTVQENSDLQMRVITFNSPSAIIGAVQARQADFTFTSNDEAGAAIRGTDEYKGQPMKDLRVALTVLPFRVGIMVKADSDIRSIADMKGKRFATGWQGFLQGIPLANAMFATANMSLKDVQGVPAANLLRAADDFKAGRTDGAQFAVGAPKVAEIHAAIGGVRFLPLVDTPEALERMKQVRPEYHIATVNPAPFLPGVAGPTPLLAYYINILTNRQTSDETVYKLVKALHGAKAQLVKGHPSFNAFTPQGMAVKHVGAEYHPGAVKFYKEAGIWKGD
ncbi:MAG TPA: TAXI family TRAP transporter solute-binding subunit [Burkholderiales bacterium]|nr:TAXI family TRAP transporter solute-binding subunit [Burkholderiales bacterium]